MLIDTSGLLEEQQIRLQCLEWAHEELGERVGDVRVIERAQHYERFVLAGSEQAKPAPTEFHDENTLSVVAETLVELTGLKGQEVREIIQALQNKGILFRERVKLPEVEAMQPTPGMDRPRPRGVFDTYKERGLDGGS